jgi:iron complex transport system ATP-binding protein
MTLEIEHAGVRYRERAAVVDFSAEFAAGGLVGLVGPNGAGKSSLVKAIAGVVAATGRFRWCGRLLETLPARGRAQTIAYLPQRPSAHWPLKVRDLVALGRLPHRSFAAPPTRADADAIDSALDATDVAALAERPIGELSGGELARVQVARALAVRAPVLLVDEPVVSLDPYHQLQIMRLLADYAADGALVVAVLHDLSLAARFCSQVALIDAGRLIEAGAPRRVLREELVCRHYRVAPYVAEHSREPVILPWRMLD